MQKPQKELEQIKEKYANLFFYAQLTKDYTVLKNMEGIIKHHSSGITWASRLIIILFIWCAGITGVLIHNYISDNENKLNQTIINQEGIPLKNITPDELEAIND